MTTLKLTDRVSASKSEPISRQWSARDCDLRANSSARPSEKFVQLAYRAAIRKSCVSPPPAIQNGMPPACTGRGCPIGPVDVVVLAIECRDAARPELAHDLHAFVEHADPVTRRRESVADASHSCWYQPPPIPHLGPSTRNDVDSRRDLGRGRAGLRYPMQVHICASAEPVGCLPRMRPRSVQAPVGDLRWLGTGTVRKRS